MTYEYSLSKLLRIILNGVQYRFMGRRNEHSRAELRALAVQAAAELVSVEGLPGMSARKVAAEIGYTVGSLYLVFRNLDELLLQVNGRTLDALHEALSRSVAACEPGERAIVALANAYVRYARSQPGLWDAVFQLRLPAGEVFPVWYEEKIQRIFALVEHALRRCAPHKSNADVTIAARALWGGVHGVCTLAHTGKLALGGRQTVEALVESLVDNYLRGWRASCGRL